MSQMRAPSSMTSLNTTALDRMVTARSVLRQWKGHACTCAQKHDADAIHARVPHGRMEPYPARYFTCWCRLNNSLILQSYARVPNICTASVTVP